MIGEPSTAVSALRSYCRRSSLPLYHEVEFRRNKMKLVDGRTPHKPGLNTVDKLGHLAAMVTCSILSSALEVGSLCVT
jgi:hypothetical protein